jgi:hypothetical protein
VIRRLRTFAVSLSGLAFLLVPAFINGAVKEEDVDTMAERIGFGIQVGLVGMLVVFIGLVTVFLSLKFLSGAARGRNRPKASSADEASTEPELPEVTAEVSHAIALALYLDLRTFEEEVPEEITIRKVTKPYSAWWHSGKTRMMIDKWHFPGPK